MVRVLASQQCGPGATPGTTDAIMWIEFVVGSLPCFERVFSRYYGFPLSLKTKHFQIPIQSGMHGKVSTSS